MTVPAGYKFTKTHEWIKVDGDTATIGLADHAQEQLGDITYLELPSSGDEVKSGEAFGVVESVKAASDIYSPVDGEIIEVNDTAVDGPEIINKSPFDDAWLIKVKLNDPSQVDALMDEKTYEEFEQA